MFIAFYKWHFHISNQNAISSYFPLFPFYMDPIFPFTKNGTLRRVPFFDEKLVTKRWEDIHRLLYNRIRHLSEDDLMDLDYALNNILRIIDKLE